MTSYWGLASVVAFQGLVKACYMGTQPLAALELFGIRFVNLVCGLLSFFIAIGSLGMSPIASYLYQTSLDNNLLGTFGVISTTYGVAAILATTLWAFQRRRADKNYLQLTYTKNSTLQECEVEKPLLDKINE